LVDTINAGSLFKEKGLLFMFSKNIVIVSVPEWRGAGRHGTELAPKAFKKFGLMEKLQAKGVTIASSYQVDLQRVLQWENGGAKSAKYEGEIVDSLQSSFLLLRGLADGQKALVVLGGDHTVSIASVAAQVMYSGNGSGNGSSKVGVIWIDAHGDVHTPHTTPSGNIHGMPLAILLGHASLKFTGMYAKVCPWNVVHIGANNLEPEEVEFFTKHQIACFPQKELDTDMGFTHACYAITQLGKRVERVVVSIDMDAFDETIAPGVHARNKNGITREKALALFDHIKSHCRVVGIDIAEIVPRKDKGYKTIELACDILVRLLAP
jgi:arginase